MPDTNDPIQLHEHRPRRAQRASRQVEDHRIAPENADRHRPGRPTVMTETTVAVFCSAIQRGLNIRQAAEVAGISEQAVHNWKRRALEALHGAGVIEGVEYDADEVLAAIPESEHRYCEFWWRFRSAESFGTLELLQKVRSSHDWHAHAWLLKHRHPDQYGDRIALTGADGGPIEVSAARAEFDARLDRLARPTAIDATSSETPRKAKRARKRA